MPFCPMKSADGFLCTEEKGHPGPCARVLWRLEGGHVKVYWWQGMKASENIGTLIKPERKGSDGDT